MVVRLLFICLLLLHGLLHVIGFAKAYELFPVPQLSLAVSRPVGLVWATAGVLFIVSAVLYIGGKGWWLPSFAAIVLSQALILSAWTDAKWGTVANIVILAAAIAGFAASRYEKRFKADFTAAIAAGHVSTGLLTENDLAGLPPVVQRYLHYTGCVGKPKVSNFFVAFDMNICLSRVILYCGLRVVKHY